MQVYPEWRVLKTTTYELSKQNTNHNHIIIVDPDYQFLVCIAVIPLLSYFDICIKFTFLFVSCTMVMHWLRQHHTTYLKINEDARIFEFHIHSYIFVK